MRSSNQSVYSVGQVNSYIKNMFAQDFMLSRIYVRGEVSNCKYHTSGHLYFSLKDASGTIACVMFAGQRRGLAFRMKDGDKVIVGGSVNVYERDGKYQLYAREISLEGAGLLYERFLALKKELEEMGMFAPEYKQPIPFYVKRLGVVTAPTGAVIQDIRNVAYRRNPYVQIVLHPALVQGEGAVESIVRGIETLDRLHLDVLIVGRGGGSIEDLWAFNEEPVAYAIYESEIPVISAVGHEPDVTISDFVADLRAATPSNAAELAVPDQDGLRQSLDQMTSAIAGNLSRQLKAARQHLNALACASVLQDPGAYIAQQRKNTEFLKNRLAAAQNQSVAQKQQRYIAAVSKLDAMSPLKVLTRGYSVTQTESGEIVRSAGQVKAGDRVHIRVSDGSMTAKILDQQEETT